jgi:hypothetical protein
MKTEKNENPDEVVEPDDGEEITVPLTLDDKISFFIARTNVENLNPCMYVYKYKANSSTQRSLCGKFDGDDIPDEHTIGLQYGSGRYLVILQVPAGEKQVRKQGSYTFEIGTVYDELRRTAAATGTLPPLYSLPIRGGLQQPSNTSQTDNMTMLRETMSFMAELFGKMQGSVPHQPQHSPDMSALMLQQYKGMGEVLKDNLLKTDAFMQEALKVKMLAEKGDRSKKGNEEYEENEPTEQPNLIQALLPELIKLLPALLSNPQTAAMVQAAASPAAAQIASNAVHSVTQAHRSAVREAARKRQGVASPKNSLPAGQRRKKSPVATTLPADENNV